MTCTLLTDPGLHGYIVLPNTIGSGPESLRRLGAMLSRQGFIVATYRASPASPQLPLAGASTTTGWLLTWSRATTRGLAACGSLWVVDGAAASEILSTLTPATG